jgi:hypothetical protein
MRRHRLPVDLVQAWTVAPYSNDMFVPGREGIGDSIRQSGAEAIAPLLRIVDVEHRESARLHGVVRVAVQCAGHPAVRGAVARHVPLRPPLVRWTVAEEQDDSM